MPRCKECQIVAIPNEDFAYTAPCKECGMETGVCKTCSTPEMKAHLLRTIERLETNTEGIQTLTVRFLNGHVVDIDVGVTNA